MTAGGCFKRPGVVDDSPTTCPLSLTRPFNGRDLVRRRTPSPINGHRTSTASVPERTSATADRAAAAIRR